MVRKIRFKEVSDEMKHVVLSNKEENTRTSIGFENNIGEYYYLSVDSLIPYHKQARKVFNQEEIESLSLSIKQYGIRQPLSVVKSNFQDGKFEVLSGERRLRAGILAGLEKIPCIVVDEQDNSEEIALIENIHRSDLHPVDLGRALNKLILQKDLTQEAISKRLSYSKSVVSELIKFSKVSDKVFDALIKQNISDFRTLRKVAKFDSDGSAINYINALSEKKIQKNINLINIKINSDGLKANINYNKCSKDVLISLKEKLAQEIEKISMILES
jgi:ParB family chromosome partitioning protein